MKKILMFLLPPLLVVVTVWIAVIVWWQMTNRLPDGADVLLWLVVLPLGLLLGYWLLKKFFDVLKRVLAALFGAAAVSNAVADDSSKESGTRTQARGYVLHLLGGSVCLPHADSISILVDKLDQPEFSPTADMQLQDEHGKPQLVTAAPDLDISTARAALQSIGGQAQQLEPTPRLIRSIAMAAQALDQTLRLLEPWGSGANSLQVMCLLPSAWPEPQRALADLWLRQQVLQSGWPKQRTTVSVIAVHGEAEVLSNLDRCNELFNQQRSDQIGLLLAMDSNLDPQALAAQPAHWFSASNNKGVVPGEGAAMIAFARSDCALNPPLETESVTALHRVASGKRDKAASAAGHIGSELLKELARQAMQVAQISMTDVARVLTDVDHRGSRLQEVSSVVTTLQTPDADPPALGRVGASMGQIGAAASVAALLAAHHATLSEHKPVLLLSALGDFERAATVVKPLVAADISA